jgi:OmpA-OmpF porin, OOP family
VFFDWDQADLRPHAATILDNASFTYQTSGQARVLVAGHADRSGPSDYKFGLSQRRADNVRQYLVGRGVPESAIAVEAHGENRTLVATDDGVTHPQNRRVEVSFPRKP